MENLTSATNENSVAIFDPAITYAGASSLKLTESEMTNLSAPFADLDYEISPDGYIYLPQVLALQRLNSVIGVGQWGLLLIQNGKELIKDGQYKVYYDGALVIRNCFVSRACGEANYSEKNSKTSFATALESAKSDCRQRCGKDLGIASDAWNPTFIRRWQKQNAVKVKIFKDNKSSVAWRRKDLDPLPYETGLAPTSPTVPSNNNQQTAVYTELPWLNEGPDYDQALRELLEGKTMSVLKKEWKLSKKIDELLVSVLTLEWTKRLDTCKVMPAIADAWNKNQPEINEYVWLKDLFHQRRDFLKTQIAKTA